MEGSEQQLQCQARVWNTKFADLPTGTLETPTVLLGRLDSRNSMGFTI
jgi:hypothetical protein